MENIQAARAFVPGTDEEAAMSDDKTNRGGQDRKRVAGGQEHETRYEAKKMDVSQDEVKRAAKAAGPSRSKVEKEIRTGK
jgi:hypothetical protein